MNICRLLNKNDALNMFEWMSDSNITDLFTFNATDKTLQDANIFIDNALSNFEVNKHYAIQDNNGEYVGTISLKNINIVENSAEYAIVIRKKFQNQGFAKKASLWMFNEAKSKFKLKIIYLTVFASNETAIQLYEKIGFIRDVSKDSILIKNGQEITQHYYEKRLR